MTKLNNCARVYRLEHNYIVRYINISTTCFGPYGHLQVGYEIRRKTIYNMVHHIHKCGVSGGRDLVYKDMEGLKNYTNSWFICDVYMYVVLAGGVIGVGLLVWGVVSAVSIRGAGAGVHTGLPGRQCGRHKMAVYLLPAEDVMWIRARMYIKCTHTDRPNCKSAQHVIRQMYLWSHTTFRPSKLVQVVIHNAKSWRSFWTHKILSAQNKWRSFKWHISSYL